MRIFDDDDPLVLDGTYDAEGYKPLERVQIDKARRQQEAKMADGIGWKIGKAKGELVTLSDVRLAVNEHALVTLGGSPTFDQWSEAAERLKRIHGAVKFWIGDLLAMGESLFSEEASQVIDRSYLSEQEVKGYTSVARAVAPSVREHAPSWDHCRAVSRLPAEQQTEWLDRARAEGWSARKLGSEVAQAQADGKTVMRWWLIVEAGTEHKRDTLADRLEGEGFTVKRQEKMAKVPKRAKKGLVTAKKKRQGLPKMNTRKRVPA